MKTLETVGQLINCLTQDEDARQDLWVHYLTGNSTDSFSSHLESISKEYSDEYKVRKAIHDLIENPPSPEFIELLAASFTDFERQVIFSLMVGLTLSEISDNLSISEVRIRQTVATIRYNPMWEQHYSAKLIEL